MNYIGSKNRLSTFLKESILQVVGKDLSAQVFCDLFAGTGIVGRTFKKEVKQVISNDLEYYSYVLNRHYIGNTKELKEAEKYIEELNNLNPQKGFVYQNYCLGSGSQRQYFSDENGQKIDAMRRQIEDWKSEERIEEDLYFFLLTSLLESADKVANTASVYGAFLKHLKRTAQKSLVVEVAKFEETGQKNKVFNEDSNALIKKIKGDILYLDPPYNARQYGANYHMLNTIAQYDDFQPKGKTGLREYERSQYCSKKEVLKSFKELIQFAQFSYIFLSYNNEGLMSLEDIKQVMSEYGKYSLVQIDYQRFKADKDAHRNHKANKTTEYLHILVKT